MFGNKKCCGNCLQGTLDRERRSAEESNFVESSQAACGRPEPSNTKIFNRPQPDAGRLFSATLADESPEA